jgi:hypothetical protein
MTNWDPSKPLPNDRQEVFVQLYCKHLSRVDAYIDAYDVKIKEGKGEADERRKTAVAALKLLNIDAINARKRYLLKQRVSGFSSSKDAIKQLMIDAVAADITNYMQWDEDGNIKLVPSDSINGKLVESLTVSRDNEGEPKRIQLKMVGKEKCLEMLAVIEGLLTESNRVSGLMSLEQRAESNKAYLERMANAKKWIPKKK